MENINFERKHEENNSSSLSSTMYELNYEEFEEDNTPNYEVESMHSDIDVEIDNEIENDIQNKILNSKNETNMVKQEKEEDDFFNFSHTFIEEPKKQSYFEKYFNMYHTNFEENQNKRRIVTSSFKTYTNEEKEEIFNKIELKNEDLKPDDDDVFNIFLNNYQYKKNIIKEIIYIEKEEDSTSNEKLILDIQDFNMDDFYVKIRTTSYSTSNKSNNSNSNYSYNFYNNNNNQNSKIKQTKFDFFKCYNNNDEEEDENDEYATPFEDSIKCLKNDNFNDNYQFRYDEINKNNSDDNSNYDLYDNYSECSNKSMTKDKIQGEISKIYYKTEEYFDKNCFSEDELLQNYDFVYGKCKPGEEFNYIFKRCIENLYFDNYFNAYFGKIFFPNIYKLPQELNNKSDDLILDEHLFNICLMDIVTKNIHPENILTRDLLGCYMYLFSFIEDIICHYYFNCEYDVNDAGSKTFDELQKMIGNEKRYSYLTTKSIPGKYLLYLSMWLYALSRKDIYLRKEAIITNIYFLDFIFNELNLNTDYESDLESEVGSISDNESIKSIQEPDFNELKMVNDNYEVEYDSFCL